MPLEDVLARIPGLAGYRAQQQFDDRQAQSQLGQLLGVANLVEQTKQRELQRELMTSQIEQKRTELANQAKMLASFEQLSQPQGGGAPGAPGQPGAPTSRLNMAPMFLAMSGMKGAPTAAQMMMKMTDPGDVEWIKSGNQQLPRFKSTGQPVPWLEPLPIGMNEYETNRIANDRAAELRQQGRAHFETGMAQPGVGQPQQPPQAPQPAPQPQQMGAWPSSGYAPGLANPAANPVGAEVIRQAGTGGDMSREAALRPAAAGDGLTPKAQVDLREGNMRKANDDFITNEYRPTLQQADSAKKMNMQIEAFRSIPIKDKTGWSTPAKAAAARILEGLGIAPEAAKQYASDAQMFNSVAYQQNWTLLQAQKGPQTEGDSQRAQKVFAQLGNTPEANEFIWDFAKAVNDAAIKKSQFYARNYGEAQRNNSVSDLESRWTADNANSSIWDNPVMKKWKDRGEGKAAPAGIRTIASDDDFNALPSGTEFVGPDGKRRRKP